MTLFALGKNKNYKNIIEISQVKMPNIWQGILSELGRKCIPIDKIYLAVSCSATMAEDLEL